MEISFSVFGNHEDVKGNAVPYTRMTQRGKFKPNARKYTKWKQYVVGQFIDHLGQCDCFDSHEQRAIMLTVAQGKAPLPYVPGIKIELNCMIYFATKNHGDPENIRKGIMDALFSNDKNVIGYYDYDYDPDRPRVEIEIAGYSEAA